MTRRLRGEGGFNSVQVGLVLALVAVGYFGWIYFPVYFEHLKLKNLVRLGCSKAYSHRTVDTVYKTILEGFPAIGMEDREIVNGQVVIQDTPFSEHNVEVGFSDNRDEVTATVFYERKIVWPLLNREDLLSFTITHTEDLSAISY